MRFYRILTRISCLTLALFLGIATFYGVTASNMRKERSAFYNSVQAKSHYYTEEQMDEGTYLEFSQECGNMIYLLHKAADKGPLFYEITTEWLRNYSYDAHLTMKADSLPPLWIPSSLHLREYQEKIAPLLRDLYVPVLSSDAKTEFVYQSLRFLPPPEESNRFSEKNDKIQLTIVEIDNVIGEQICKTSIYYSHIPNYPWESLKQLSTRDQEILQPTVYGEITTADGHTLTYYTPKRIEGQLELGSSWGETYIIKNAPMFFTPSYSSSIPSVDMLHSLSQSTLVSYADYLENDAEVEEQMADYWKQIRRQHTGCVILIIGIALSFSASMYGAITLFVEKAKVKKKQPHR